MPGKQVLNLKLGYRPDTLLQGLPIAVGQVGSPHTLVEDHVTGKKGFPYGPVQTKGTG